VDRIATYHSGGESINVVGLSTRLTRLPHYLPCAIYSNVSRLKVYPQRRRHYFATMTAGAVGETGGATCFHIPSRHSCGIFFAVYGDGASAYRYPT